MTTYHELLTQRDALDAQISDALRAESVEAIDTVRRLIADYELTATECGFVGASSATVTSIKPKKWRAPAPVKFRGPNGETWTGKGRRPTWLGALIEDGHSCEEYLVEKDAA